MKMRLLVCLVAGYLLLASTHAGAHEIRPGYLEISETTPGSYQIIWKAPMLAGRPLAVAPRFPQGCETTGTQRRSNQPGSLTRYTTLSCQAPLQGQRIELEGLDATLTDAIVRLQLADDRSQTHRATPDAPVVQLLAEVTTGNVMRTYFALGVEHILSGVDHLLFVLALVLLITGTRRLIETITAFTVAHSITLIAASLGWMTLPGAPVEAVIALSIVFLANEIASKEAGTMRLSERRPWFVAFVFGLLHGFGFAGALADIGLPEREVPIALLTFNLGVEAGQLMFLALVLVLLRIVMQLQLRRPFDAVASYAIGITASVWLLERVF